jgi:serine/threonine protein phosphatase PrpC
VVSVEHTPERERARIDAAGGLVSVESELSIAKIQGMDLSDPFVARRLLQGRRLESRVSRLCGELGVSRALGDAGYKGAARMAAYAGWLWPADRAPAARCFVADLVLGAPDVSHVAVGRVEGAGASGLAPFLIVACDGLWEVLTNEEAVDLAAHHLREARYCTPRDVAAAAAAGQGGAALGAARRLVELALKLGSSDHITAMVVLLA